MRVFFIPLFLCFVIGLVDPFAGAGEGEREVMTSADFQQLVQRNALKRAQRGGQLTAQQARAARRKTPQETVDDDCVASQEIGGGKVFVRKCKDLLNNGFGLRGSFPEGPGANVPVQSFR